MSNEEPDRENASVLLIEDSASLSALYEKYLQAEGYNATVYNLAKPALQWLESNTPDAILLDLKLPDQDGFGVLERIKSKNIPSEVLIITAHGSVDTAVKAIRAGASDFLEKPFDAKRLQTSLKNVLEKSALKREVEQIRQTFFVDRFEGFIGASLEMQSVYKIIESAARSKATVFITGESGTGKEVCAEAIHKQSARRDGPFVPINCAAIPKDLMESEIFGHTKGAFTGAHKEREGAAGKADGGTLFLDEICELDLDLQSKFLRFIQTETFQKVGSDRSENVDIRIVCATNRDPAREVREGRFREDLFYRLHVIPVSLPPLRSRDDDVLLLAKHMLEKFSAEEGKSFQGFSEDAKSRLVHHNWPGNVRELQNVIRNAVVLNDDPFIEAEQLSILGTQQQPLPSSTTPETPTQSVAEQLPTVSEDVQPLWVVEKNAIQAAITACEGNVPKAASLLEVSPSTLYRKLQSWED